MFYACTSLYTNHIFRFKDYHARQARKRSIRTFFYPGLKTDELVCENIFVVNHRLIFLSLRIVKILATSLRTYLTLPVCFFKVPFAPSDLIFERSVLRSVNFPDRSSLLISLSVFSLALAISISPSWHNPLFFWQTTRNCMFSRWLLCWLFFYCCLRLRRLCI